MLVKAARSTWPVILATLMGAGVLLQESVRPVPASSPAEVIATRPIALVQKRDRIAWIGSSSTRIGVWPKTVQFLIRTRHPDLGVTFQSCSTGGGTFQTALEKIDGWLDEAKPSLVVLNFGGNDANAGTPGLEAFRDRMEQCVSRVRAHGARALLVTPQGADPRKSGREAAAKRATYAETMLDHGRALGWPVIDVHGPLEALQRQGQREDPCYSILKDRIHLTDPAYVAWGYYFYDRLDLPRAVSDAQILASGRVTWTSGCQIRDLRSSETGLSFTRVDEVLPILPPVPLPPRSAVPLESLSPYRLRVVGLESGMYDLFCDGKPIGSADSESFRYGVNLNTLLLDSGHEAPWKALAGAIWDGKTLDEVGRPAWRYELRKRPAAASVAETPEREAAAPSPR